MKPILFNSDMVRAILAGKKTQTRRILKMDYIPKDAVFGYDIFTRDRGMNEIACRGTFGDGYGECFIKRPYIPGEILYVRETFGYGYYAAFGQEVFYKADYPNGKPDFVVKWHPSIHMPKEAARIFLRVTNVRVERLNSITEEEVFKEGYRGCETVHTVYHVDPPEACWNVPDCPRNLDCLRLSFAEMFGSDVWDKTIKPGDLDRYGWYANPWVWVIEFERIEKEE